MRASRLLRILLILQNRGRTSARELAAELEVAPRTVLRDVEAMNEAGLPILSHPGYRGGIELGFNYRTRLTGLSQDEAEALGAMLSGGAALAEAAGMGKSLAAARAKLIESFPDRVRHTVERAAAQFYADPKDARAEDDPRVPALAMAVRNGRIVRINARSRAPQTVHPLALVATVGRVEVADGLSGVRIPLSDCGDINISAKRFDG